MRTRMQAEDWGDLPAEVYDILGSASQFQHLVIPCGLEATSLELVPKLRSLLVLGLIVQVVLKLHYQLKRLPEAVHH